MHSRYNTLFIKQTDSGRTSARCPVTQESGAPELFLEYLLFPEPGKETPYPDVGAGSAAQTLHDIVFCTMSGITVLTLPK